MVLPREIAYLGAISARSRRCEGDVVRSGSEMIHNKQNTGYSTARSRDTRPLCKCPLGTYPSLLHHPYSESLCILTQVSPWCLVGDSVVAPAGVAGLGPGGVARHRGAFLNRLCRPVLRRVGSEGGLQGGARGVSRRSAQDWRTTEGMRWRRARRAEWVCGSGRIWSDARDIAR